MSDATKEKGGGAPWRWIGLVLLIALLLALGRLLPFEAWLQRFQEWIAGMGAAGMILFALVYAAAAVAFVPGSILTLGAGFTFGLLWGTVAVSAGSTLGAMLAFLVARYLARDRVLQWARRDSRFLAVDRAVGRQGHKIVFLLRLSPLIPFNLSNYLYGLTAVPFWPYVAASWLGMLPGTVLYVYLGHVGRTGLEAAAGSGSESGSLQTLGLIVGLAATLGVTWWVSRIARRALEQTRLEEEME